MTGDGDLARPGDAAVKDSVLLSYDLAMLLTARKYNLTSRDHRDASHRALTNLFFDFCGIAGIDLFVEAGAKEASASRRARARFDGVRAVAFEANPFTYGSYAKVNADADVEYLNRALTNEPGPVTMNVHRDEDGTPLANGQASLLKRDKDPRDRERGFEEVTVDGIPLDSFFEGHEFERAAIWVDVEGACQYVLPGARQLLSRTAVLMIEVEDQQFWGEGHWLREQVVSYLYDLGLVPVARDYEYVHQYNLVFLRADLLTGPNRFRAHLAQFVSKAGDPPRRRRDPAGKSSTTGTQSLASARSNAVLTRVRRYARRVIRGSRSG
jgi:FkbM family methyltransferase